MLHNLPDLFFRLKENPLVLGVVRYGRRRLDDANLGGDFDLVVFLESRPEDLESIHFHCGEIPVDLSLRTLGDLERENPLSWIDLIFSEGEILLDRTGDLERMLCTAATRWQPESPSLGEYSVNMNRFCQTHALDKVRHRLESDPLLCEFLLSTNIFWLVQTYFSVRSKPYPGERGALEHLQRAEPDIHRGIQSFYAQTALSEKFRIAEELTEQVLSPIGGPWKKRELIPLGTKPDADNLQEQGEMVFKKLFSSPGE
jgi:hypothetical protein